MKKLSFIMAIIMIVMTFPMMFMTSASATAGQNPAGGYVMTEEDTASGKLCKTGDEYYDDIREAIVAAEDGATIYVFKKLDLGTYRRYLWKLGGKDITIDFLGNTMETSGDHSNFSVGVTYDGTENGDKDVTVTGLTEATKGNASTLTIKNANIVSVKGLSPFQIYPYMSLVLDNTKVEIKANAGYYGLAISQSYSTLKLVNGCEVYGYHSNAANNTNGAVFRFNGAFSNVIVEDSYVYADGSVAKYAANGNFVAKNSKIETGYQNAFILSGYSDNTIDIDNCVINLYTKGSLDSDLGAFVWQHSSTNRTKVSVKNSNLTAYNMKASQYIIGIDDASKKTLGNEYTFENTNVTANGGNLFYIRGDVDFTIDGGTYITDGRIICQNFLEAVNQARTTIYGGQFIARNHTKNIGDFNGKTPLSGAILASNGVSLDIYGGTFALYQDSNSVFNTTAPILYSWSGASELIKVYGGTFSGGCGMMARVTYSGDEKAPYAAENAKIYAYEEGKTSVEIAPAVKKGASIRLDAKSGLRFSSDINAWTVNYVATELAKEGTTVEYGTMITRSSYLKYTSGEFTMAAFDAKGMTSRYINVVAKDGIVKNADGSVTIHAALVDIDADNYQKDFVAISYIKYTNANDEVAYIYAGNVSLAENSRNIEEVALAALADVQLKAGGAYTNAVSEYYVYNMAARKYELVKSTAYSAYTADQIKALQSYIVVED